MAHRDSLAELSALTEALVLEHRAEEARYAAILNGQPVAARKAEGLDVGARARSSGRPSPWRAPYGGSRGRCRRAGCAFRGGGCGSIDIG